MIVYIASYPRSGNFWTQCLLANQFGRIITRFFTNHQNRNDNFQSFVKFNREYYDIDILDAPQEDFAAYQELAAWMVYATIQGNDQKYKAILPGCGALRETHIREMLAKDSEVFFIKTHLLPYSNFFDGEYVVQPIRNAGASVWSYYLFGRDVMKESTSLLQKITNQEAQENWSHYHREWLKASETLGSRYFQYRYEDLAGHELEFCDQLQSFLSLPIYSREIKPFDFYHKLRPTIVRTGKSRGWEENFSQEQLHLFWQEHGEMMTRLGYSEPNYAFASN